MEQKKFYHKTWFLIVLGILLPVVGIIILWTAQKERPKNTKIILSVLFAIWGIIVLSTNSGNRNSGNTPSNTEQPSVQTTISETVVAPKETIDSKQEESTDESKGENSENDDLKVELKDKYDVGEPAPFVKGDKTGKWRIVKVATSIPTSDYAVEYAKAYMTDTDIHYIVNFTLKTTTMLNLLDGKLKVKTTEYVDKEEHDATEIGSGTLYSEQYFDFDTGKEFTVEADSDAGSVDENTLIETIKGNIDGTIGDGEKITDVLLDGNNLVIKVDLSNANTNVIEPKYIAISRISSITDEILNLDDSIYNSWETITLEFGDIGTAVLDKNMVKNNGYGKYFDFTDDVLK